MIQIGFLFCPETACLSYLCYYVSLRNRRTENQNFKNGNETKNNIISEPSSTITDYYKLLILRSNHTQRHLEFCYLECHDGALSCKTPYEQVMLYSSEQIVIPPQSDCYQCSQRSPVYRGSHIQCV